MSLVVLLVSECKSLCPPASFENLHPGVAVDHVRDVDHALKLIPVARPDLVVLGPGVADSEDFRRSVKQASPLTRVGVLGCPAGGENSEQCVLTRADFLHAIRPLLG
jgi:hypothetical protein